HELARQEGSEHAKTIKRRDWQQVEDDGKDLEQREEGQRRREEDVLLDQGKSEGQRDDADAKRVHHGAGQRDGALPDAVAHKVAPEVDGPTWQTNATKEYKEQRQDDAEHGVDVFERVEGKVGASAVAVVAAEVSCGGVGELVEAEAEDPASGDQADGARN